MASVSTTSHHSHARPTKGLFDKETSQKKRRELFLDWQQRRRDEILDKIRQLESSDGSSDSEADLKYDFLEVMKSRKRKHGLVEDENKPVRPVDSVRDESGLSAHPDHSGTRVHYQNLEEVPDAEFAEETASPSTAMEIKVDMGLVPEAQEGNDMEVQVLTKKKKKKKKSQQLPYQPKSKREPPIKLMLSEWLTEKPEDFEESWAGVLCPVGKRILLVAYRRTTKVFSRKGEYLGHFQSMLPSGNQGCYKAGNRNRGITMLDCIWSDTSQVFYVLDLIFWNSHSCINCDMDYRQYFLASRFEENPELQLRNRQNLIPLIILPYFRALDFCQGQAKTLYPSFPEPVDGLLFYHREGFYIPEANPLCLWILLNQVHERLGVDLPIELRSRDLFPSKRQPPTQKKEDETKQAPHPFNLQG